MRRRFALAAAAAAVAAVPVLLGACGDGEGVQSFSSGLPPEARGMSFVAGGRCSVDSISATRAEDVWRAGRDKPLRFSGWAIETSTMTTSDWLVVELAAPNDARRFFAGTTTRGERGDLMAALGAGPGLSKAAFELIAAPGDLPAGRYTVRLLFGSAAGGISCTTPVPLELH